MEEIINLFIICTNVTVLTYCSADMIIQFTLDGGFIDALPIRFKKQHGQVVY